VLASAWEYASPMRRDTVIFDLGGVLVDWNPRYLYRKLISDEPGVERFLAEVCTQEWNQKQDAGRSWGRGHSPALQKAPGSCGLDPGL
jgi:2-haloacid dehalogenase